MEAVPWFSKFFMLVQPSDLDYYFYIKNIKLVCCFWSSFLFLWSCWGSHLNNCHTPNFHHKFSAMCEALSTLLGWRSPKFSSLNKNQKSDNLQAISAKPFLFQTHWNIQGNLGLGFVQTTAHMRHQVSAIHLITWRDPPIFLMNKPCI